MTWADKPGWLAVALAATAGVPTTARAEPVSAGAVSAQAPSGSATQDARSQVKVATTGCGELRPERVEELLRLEIATLVPVVEELPPLDVDLLCSGSQVRVTLRDPVTVKVVSRDVWLGASADPERALALAASELFLASWAELLIAPRPREETRGTDSAAVVAKEAVERALPQLPVGRSLAIDLSVVGRDRHVSAPLPTLGATIRFGQAAADQHQLFAEAGWEMGTVRRPIGRVDVDATAVGAGMRWTGRLGSAALGMSGAVSGVYVSLQGVSASPEAFGAHYGGFTVQAAGAVDASVTLRALRLGVAAQVGFLAPGPVGLVDGGQSVRLDGVWAGASCFVGLLL
jgi:hypothetical protein